MIYRISSSRLDTLSIRLPFPPLPSLPFPPLLLSRADLGTGDSYTVGFGNVGGTTHCNATVCESDGSMEPATLSWTLRMQQSAGAL